MLKTRYFIVNMNNCIQSSVDIGQAYKKYAIYRK